MKRADSFIERNIFVLIFMLAGIILGYVYWVNWGMYCGTLPLSSECWVNCTYGGLMGGFVGSYIKK